MDDVITEIAPDDDDDDLFLPPATTTARTLNKFQPKPCGKPKKRIAAALNPSLVTSDARAVPEEPFSISTGKGNPGQDATVAECTESVVVPITEPSSAAAPIAGSSQLNLVEEAAHVIGAPEVDTEVLTAFDMEDDPLFDPSGPTEQAVSKFRPKRHPKTTQSTPSSSNSDDNTLHHSSPTGDIDAANLSSVSCETMDFSSHVIETQESVNKAKGSSNHDWNCQDGPEVFENENNLQTDTDKPEEEAMPVPSGMESHDDLLSPPSDTAVKQTSKYQPRFASRPRKQKAKSVSFSLPDAATTAASPVRDHSDVLADNSTGTEVSSIQMMHDESVDNLLHTTSVISDNVTIQLDQGDARNEVLTDLSGRESFDSILPELCSVTGKTVPKFRPKRGAKSKTLKLNSSSDTNSAKESTPSQWDSVSMDADPLTNLANEQTEPVERLPVEAGSPGGNEVFETIDTPLDRDSYIVGKEKLSVGSEDTGNEVQFWNDEEQTHNPSQEHEAGKSLRKLRKRVAAGSPGKLDDGISENNYSQMDEYHDDDENRGVPKQRKQSKRSKRQTTDAQKPAKRHRKTSKDPESTKTEPPKKRFPHGIRRGRRQVDKALLETSEYEDRTQIVLRQLIRLGEANERNASKEAADLKNNQSNNGSFSNGINIDPNNPYDEDLDPYGEEAHRNMLRNSRKLNYQTHMPKPQRGKWSKSETESFYEAIRQFGTDFGMIEKLFPNRTRHQVKLKFKNEERKHPAELHDAMSHRSKDLSHFEKVIQQLKAQAEESRPDDANDVVDVNEEERDQPEIEPEKEEHDANGFDGKTTDSGKRDEWDADGTTDYNEYESVDWDVGASSSQNEEKYAEYDEFY